MKKMLIEKIIKLKDIKCNGIKNGLGMGSEYFKTDELNKKLFSYLYKVN